MGGLPVCSGGGGGGAVRVAHLLYKGGGLITGLKKVFQNKVQCT